MNSNNTTASDNKNTRQPEDSQLPAPADRETLLASSSHLDTTSNTASPEFHNSGSLPLEENNRIFVGDQMRQPVPQAVAPQKQPTERKKSKTILFVVIAMVVLGAIGILGWKVENGASKTKTSRSKPAPTVSYATCLQYYHDANLCHYYITAINPSSYRSVIQTTIVTVGGNTTTATYESDNKGNSESSVAGLTTVTVNGASYVRTSNTGPWTVFGTKQPKAGTNPADYNTFGIGSKTSGATFKNLGTIACGPSSCYKYQILGSSSVPTTAYIWFDAKSYKLMEYYTSDRLTTSDTTYHYGSVPTITVPSAVK